MPVTITLPDPLVARLQARAERAQQPLEEVALELLDAALHGEEWPTLDDLVAHIKATPPDPSAIHPAMKPLAELLENSPPPDPDFDAEEWNRQWARIEAEINAASLMDDIIEGHYR